MLTESPDKIEEATKTLLEYLDPQLNMLYSARIADRAGATMRAIESYFAFLSAVENEPAGPAHWLALIELADAFRRQGAHEKSLKHARESLAIAERALSSPGSRERKELHTCITESATLCIQLLVTNGHKYAPEALELAERARTHKHLEQASTSLSIRPEGLPEEFYKREDFLLKSLIRLREDARYALPYDQPLNPTIIRSSLLEESLLNEYQEVLDSLPPKWQWYVNIRKGRPAGQDLCFERIATHDPEARVLIFHAGPEIVVRWFWDSKGITDFCSIPIPVSEISTMCSSFLESLCVYGG